MSILHAESYGHLSDGNHVSSIELLGNQWASLGGHFIITDEGNGRKWFKRYDTNNILMHTGTWANQYTISVCFTWIRRDDAPFRFLKFENPTAVDRTLNVNINAHGCIHLDRDYWSDGFSQPVLVSPPTPRNVETFVEIQIYFHNTAGWAKIWFNGSLVAQATNTDTAAAATYTTNALISQLYELGADCEFTGFLFHNGTSPLPVHGLYYCPVNDSGSDADFTPSAGSNEDNVDEVGPDEDSTYNESDGTAGHRDSLAFDGTIPDNIIAVVGVVRSRKTGAGAATILPGIVHSGSEDQASAITLGTAYRTDHHIVEDCPSTASPWTDAQVAAAEVSYECGA